MGNEEPDPDLLTKRLSETYAGLGGNASLPSGTTDKGVFQPPANAI